MEDTRIGLYELVNRVREEFIKLTQESPEHDILFQPQKIEIETKVIAQKDDQGSGSLKLWVIDLSTSAKDVETRSHTIKLSMDVKQRNEDGFDDSLTFGDQ